MIFRFLLGQSIAGLSNKRCVCSRRAPFVSVFIVLVSPASGVKASGLWLALCHLPDQHHSAPNDDVMLLPTPNSAAVTREEKGKPRLQLRSL